MYASSGVKENEDGSYSVVGARNDKNTGVYIADDNNEWDIYTSERIAYTKDPFTFLVPDDVNGGFTKRFADVTFSLNDMKDGNEIYSKFTGEWKSFVLASGISMNSLPLLAILSQNTGRYDLKTNSKYANEKDKYYMPYMRNGKIITIRGLSNEIFGANLRAINSLSLDQAFVSPKGFYNLTMPVVGGYNQYQNNRSNFFDGGGYNMGYQHYGEHIYSGTNIHRGYFGSRAYIPLNP